ncbi:MAG: methyltransferase [Gaiellaceae bacterium]
MAGASPPPTSLVLEPGSFRDWDGRVFLGGDRVQRALTEAGLADWNALAASDLFARFTAAGELVATEQADHAVLSELQRLDPGGRWVGALSHQRLPFVSYPYEWSFSMLKDAALLQLRLVAAALAEGLMLKDATPYNVQWRGSQPVFVDIGSFERAREGEPWAAYRQFCMLFLYPLMLEAYRGVPFQPWLRGSIDGISPTDFRALLTRRDAVRRGMLRHVFLHAGLERRYADRGADVRGDLQKAGFDRRLVEASVASVTALVGRLRPRAGASTWSEYDSTCSYLDAETSAKEEFVRCVVGQRRRRVTWDLGCNEGRFSRIATEGADLVVAVDSDRAVVDALYTSLRDEGNRAIVPLVVDLADPSPAIGWDNAERATLASRGLPDLSLCLALVHHLSISRNVPLGEIVRWLRSLGGEVVVEFPDRGDPMVRRLLVGKREDAHPDYSRDTFEELLRDRFEVLESLALASGTRTLYHAVPR